MVYVKVGCIANTWGRLLHEANYFKLNLFNMKKIFVTVAEFRRGGGALVKGRNIHYADGDEAWIYVDVKDYNNINVEYIGVNFPMHEDRAYVQINCTPHYI